MEEESENHKQNRKKSVSSKKRHRHSDPEDFNNVDEGSTLELPESPENGTERHSSHKKHHKGSHSKRHHHHHSKRRQSEHKKKANTSDEKYFDANGAETGNDSHEAHVEVDARAMGHRLEHHPIERSSSEELQQRRKILMCVAISVSIGTVIGALIGYGVYAWVSSIQSGYVELNNLSRNSEVKDVFNFRTTTLSAIKKKISEGNEEIYNTDSKSTLDVKVGVNALGCGTLHKSVENFYENARRGHQKEQNDLQKISGRIVGGKLALIEHHPWQVSLWVSSSHKCGGSIIASNWILFAAHCVIPYPKAENWTVHVGETDRRYMMERGQTVKATDLVVHESFDEDTFDNDLALLRLKTNLELNDKVQTICLPSSHMKIQPDAMCTVSGWGASTEDDWRLPHQLQHTVVTIISRDICNADDWLMGMVTNNMFCAGTEDGSRDACQGDSGGPLTYYDPEEGRSYLMGLVSWGIGCGEPLMPGVYTNTPLYLNWIREAMIRAENRYFSTPS